MVHCQVVRSGSPSGAESASIERLDPGETVRLSFNKYKRQADVAGKRDEDLKPTGTLSSDGVRQVALHLQQMSPGEVCLVASLTDEVKGLTVTPEARQMRQAALLVAHLDSGKLGEPMPDVKNGPNAAAPLSPEEENTDER